MRRSARTSRAITGAAAIALAALVTTATEGQARQGSGAASPTEPARAKPAGNPAAAGPDAERDALVRNALSAAPPTMRDRAKVVDLKGQVLRDGSGAFTCLPAPQGFAGPMCLDAQWMRWLDAYANKRPPEVTRLGLAYMLAGDSADGGASNVNPFDEQPTADNDWMVEGPHVMILVPDPALLADIPAEHEGGGPYVMWKGTPYAHVMMPVGDRPEQRHVSGR